MDAFLTFFIALLAHRQRRNGIRKRFYAQLRHRIRTRLGKVTH